MVKPRFMLIALSAAALASAGVVACDDDAGDGDADADTDMDANADGDADGDPDADGDADGDGDAAPDAELDTTPEEACVAPCAMLVPCIDTYGDREACEAACVTAFGHLEPFGTGCLVAYADFLACWGGLGCDELEDYYSRASGSFPCETEERPLAAECMPGVTAPERDSCRAGCIKSAECFGSARNVDVVGCFRACGIQLTAAAVDGAECTSALLAARSCGHALGCSDYAAWLGKAGDSYPCHAEDDVAAAACPSM